MSYKTQATLAGDFELHRRIAACAATQQVPAPMEWVAERMWAFSAEPGWDAAYESALASGVVEPGGDGSVISDGMILASVQKMLSA